jgi:hypothetical protein
MDFGLTYALMNFGILTFLTILLIALSVHEKRREKKEKEGMRMKAGAKEYKTAA